MEAEYFSDTDTLLLTFSEAETADHISVNENLLVELDQKGGLVAITIEHAEAQTNISSFLFKKAS